MGPPFLSQLADLRAPERRLTEAAAFLRAAWGPGGPGGAWVPAGLARAAGGAARRAGRGPSPCAPRLCAARRRRPVSPRGPRAPAGGRAGIKGGSARGGADSRARTADLGARSPARGRAGAAAPTPRTPDARDQVGDARPLCVGLAGAGAAQGPGGGGRAERIRRRRRPVHPRQGRLPGPALGWPVCRRVPALRRVPGAAGAANGVWPRRSGGARAGGGQVSPAAVGQRRVLPGAHPGSQDHGRPGPSKPSPPQGHAESSPPPPTPHPTLWRAPQLPCTVLGTQLWASCESGRSGPEEEGVTHCALMIS